MDQGTEANKAIITVVGRDHKGIIAAVATALSERNANILDISQTVLQEFFTMVMLVDISDIEVSLSELNEALNQVGDKIGTVITCQHEDLFKYMHRI